MKNTKSSSILDKAYKLVAKGNHKEAISILQDAHKKSPGIAEIPVEIANIYGAKGEFIKSEEYCRIALSINNKNPVAHAVMGNSLFSLKRFEEAEKSYLSAIAIDSTLEAAFFMLLQCQLFLNKSNEAGETARSLLSSNKSWTENVYKLCEKLVNEKINCISVMNVMSDYDNANSEINYRIGKLLLNNNDFSNSIQFLNKAELINNQTQDLYYLLGVANANIGNINEAIHYFIKQIEIDRNHTNSKINLATLYLGQGKINESMEICQSVLDVDPDNINAACLMTNIYEQTNQHSKALPYVEDLVKSNILNINIGLAYASLSKPLNIQNKAIDYLHKIINELQDKDSVSAAKLYFNLGNLYDSINDYDNAFHYYNLGNKSRNKHFSHPDYTKSSKSCLEKINRNVLKSMPTSDTNTNLPVFIVGMPRSGTSLVEQILASHNQVHGGGELPFLGQLISETGKFNNVFKSYPHDIEKLTKSDLNRISKHYFDSLKSLDNEAMRITDKTPGNFFYLPLVQLLFPNASIIHCVRNPVDIALSCYFQDFMESIDWCYDLKNIANYYNAYTDIMDHWKSELDISILDVRYEQLVDDQEGVSKEIIDHCGLEWDNACLDFYKNKRHVATASYSQVRQPIYKKSVNRWIGYKPYLDEFINSLSPTAKKAYIQHYEHI